MQRKKTVNLPRNRRNNNQIKQSSTSHTVMTIESTTSGRHNRRTKNLNQQRSRQTPKKLNTIRQNQIQKRIHQIGRRETIHRKESPATRQDKQSEKKKGTDDKQTENPTRKPYLPTKQ